MCDSDFSSDSSMDVGDVDTSFDSGDIDIDTSGSEPVDIDTAISDAGAADIDFSDADLSDTDFNDISDAEPTDISDVSDDMAELSDVEPASLDEAAEESDVITDCEAADLEFEEHDLAPEEFENVETADLGLDESIPDLPESAADIPFEEDVPEIEPELSELSDEQPDITDIPADGFETELERADDIPVDAEAQTNTDIVEPVDEVTESPLDDFQQAETEPEMADIEADMPDEVSQTDADEMPETITDIAGEEQDEMTEQLDTAEQLEEAEEDAVDSPKVLRRDADELVESGARNIEDILDMRRDDMNDKGMSDTEIEEALAQERADLQEEFLHDAFPGQDVSTDVFDRQKDAADIPPAESEVPDTEENPDDNSGDVKVLRRDPDELMETGMRNVEDILDMRREDMLDKGMSDSEIEENLAREREELRAEFMRDAFPAGETASDLPDQPAADIDHRADSDQLEEQAAPDITEEERAQIIRDVVDQNVTASALPKNGGHWLDDTAPGDTTWVLDDDAKISWQKGGSRHTMSGRELKEKYHIDGVEYSGKEPDFSPFEDAAIGHVELDDFSGQRTGKNGTYASATRAAADALGWEPDQVEQYMEEKGLTWHECGDRRTVRAIPTEINAAFKHTGGIGVERSMDAMSDELHERYGDFSFKREPYSGTASVDDINDALENVQQSYKVRKRTR